MSRVNKVASFESRLIFAENSANLDEKVRPSFSTIDFFMKKERVILRTYLKNIFNEISSKNVFIQLGKNCWRFVVLFLYH